MSNKKQSTKKYARECERVITCSKSERERKKNATIFLMINKKATKLINIVQNTWKQVSKITNTHTLPPTHPLTIAIPILILGGNQIHPKFFASNDLKSYLRKNLIVF